MKRILSLFLLLASCAFGQSFPVKANSSGTVTEPANLKLTAPFISFNSTNLQNSSGALNTVQDLATNSTPNFGGMTISSSATDFTKLILSNGGGGDVYYIRSYGTAPSFDIFDASASRQLIFFAASGQPRFPYLNTAGVVTADGSGNLAVVANGANNTFYGINSSGVVGFYASSGTISGLTTNAMVYANGATSIASTTAATNGQILIGSTGAAPVKATITQSSANQVVVTNGAGSITLSLPQNIHSGATPTFAGLTLNGNLSFSPTTAGPAGTATNDSASSGVVGEYVSATVVIGSAVSLTNSTAANVTSISLTAGDWEVSGAVYYSGTSASQTGQDSSINTTTGTITFAPGTWVTSPNVTTTTTNTYCHVFPSVRESLSGTTTVYLVARANFTAGSVAAYGIIRARRVR